VFRFLVLLPATFFSTHTNQEVPSPAPAMNMDAIHPIYCADNGGWQGTGFMIADNTLATANHVVGDDCRDMVTGNRVRPYKQDVEHDFALMHERDTEYGPYLHYNCQRPVPGRIYLTYGYSSKGLPDFFHPILRNNAIVATNKFVFADETINGDEQHTLIRFYELAGAEGTSGGPVADAMGNVIAINNAGDNETTVDYDLADTGLCTGKWDD